MLFIVMHLSLLVSNIVWGGEGGCYSSDVITDCLQNSLSINFHSILLIQACQGLLSGIVEWQEKLSRVLQCLVEWSGVGQYRVKGTCRIELASSVIEWSIEWSRVVKSEVECGGSSICTDTCKCFTC